MIKISRSGVAPVVNYAIGTYAGQSKCAIKTQALCDLFSAGPASYISGANTFTFDEDILKNDVFISVFKSSQNNKCCYCQNDLDPGEVEHFRPKGYFQQRLGGRIYRPGYYWLAYEWSNLLFACGGCNTSYKGNLFPIYNISQRAKSHNDNHLLESPVLINPLIDEPSTFIFFNKEKIKYRGPNRKGFRTINILGLDRTALNDQRREYLNDIIVAKNGLSLSKRTSKETEARGLWARYISQKKRKYSKFSAMVNDSFKSTYL